MALALDLDRAPCPLQHLLPGESFDLFAEILRALSGSHVTRRWREMKSTPRSPVRRLTQTRSNGDVQHPCAAVGHARLAHPTIRDDDRSYPRSVIPGRDALACRDLVGLRRRTGDVIRFPWNGNGTLPALRPPLTRFSTG